MDDIMKMIEFFQDLGLLIKNVSKWLRMKQKNNKVDFSECYEVY